ncbi:15998_t:CDS:2, partial [Funneliformis caledonium]
MMNAEARPQADTLPCLFATLTEIYSSSSPLSLCETKQKQQWRHATGKVAFEQISSFAEYFPELVPLRNKSIHINQRKRLWHTIDKNVSQLLTADDTPQLKAVNEIGIQVSLPHSDMDSLLLQLSQNEVNLYALEFQR